MPHMAEVFSTGAPVRGVGGMMRPGAEAKVGEYNCHAMLVAEARDELRADATRNDAQFVIIFPAYANVQRGHFVVIDGVSWGKRVEIVGVAAPGAKLARAVYGREPR